MTREMNKKKNHLTRNKNSYTKKKEKEKCKITLVWIFER